MGDDSYWEGPPPPAPKVRRGRPAAAQREGDWDVSGDAAGRDQRRLRLPWRYARQAAAGLGVVAALGLAALALVEGRAETLDLSNGAGLRPVVAAVPLGDGRTPDQICRDYDIPVQLCQLSRDCRAALRQEPGPDANATARSELLILRSTDDSCGKTVAHLRRQTNRP